MESLKTDPFLKTIIKTVTDYNMLKSGDSLLIGVSGGPDSIALLHSLVFIAPYFSINKIGVAHLNHMLRGQFSDSDEIFVKSVCNEINITFYSKKEDVQTYQKNFKLSLEDAAREIRYNFYKEILKEYGFNKVALGHHADDNTESILMYLIRGSGTLGLSGIPPFRENMFIRPLIRLPKSKILDFLHKYKLEYIIDQSNEDKNFIRNKIRHELLPLLKHDYNPKVAEAINRLGFIIRDEEEWIEKHIEELFTQTVACQNKNCLSLNILKINELHIAVKRRIIRYAIEKVKGNLKKITYLHIEKTIDMMLGDHNSGNLKLPENIQIVRKNETLFIVYDKNLLENEEHVPEFNYEILDLKAVPTDFEDIRFIKELDLYINFKYLQFIDYEKISNVFSDGPNTAFFDLDKLSFPLIVRNFLPGDRFTPLGMSGSQKVKKFFINNKIPREKRLVCPIFSSNSKIIWLAGYRIDDNVKVTHLTHHILKVSLTKSTDFIKLSK